MSTYEKIRDGLFSKMRTKPQNDSEIHLRWVREAIKLVTDRLSDLLGSRDILLGRTPDPFRALDLDWPLDNQWRPDRDGRLDFYIGVRFADTSGIPDDPTIPRNFMVWLHGVVIVDHTLLSSGVGPYFHLADSSQREFRAEAFAEVMQSRLIRWVNNLPISWRPGNDIIILR
ncbi:hypothetical protein [Chitinimonas lacunae]|uniref:Immunity protein 63 domain-containing protein n=1 Tax=Chitinimonas lacunae TaxID=1963018 RepID=A0ABV8MII4_9NEIS